MIKSQRPKFAFLPSFNIAQQATFLLLFLFIQNLHAQENDISESSEVIQLKQELEQMKAVVQKLEDRVISLQEVPMREHPNPEKTGSLEEVLEGLSISGQMTAIYQSSGLDLKPGQLFHADGTPLSKADLSPLQHDSGSGTFSADIVIEKKLSENSFFLIDFQFANGPGVDAPFQGGAMVNNDVMEDPDDRTSAYIAKAFYEHLWEVDDHWAVTLDIGKFGVNDFFDVGKDVADQTSQFLNQAINNNGAFDYVQGLEGHGTTYGARVGIQRGSVTLDVAFFSSDSYLENISDKNSIVVGLSFAPEWYPGIQSVYQIYAFRNSGEYGHFDNQGNLVSKNSTEINTVDNEDNLDKTGYGVSLNHSLPSGVNLFAKYGRQDDDRDVRHYQDMDESYMLGFDVHGENWSREDDVFGVAFEVGRLTGNHRKAHEKGYSGLFDRSGGVGAGNYADEQVFEAYYKYGLNKHAHVSLDYQWINNFYYSKLIKDVHLFAARFNVSF